jgi:hypothetical protein
MGVRLSPPAIRRGEAIWLRDPDSACAEVAAPIAVGRPHMNVPAIIASPEICDERDSGLKAVGTMEGVAKCLGVA